MYVHQKTCMRTYIATLFVRTSNRSNTSAVEWISKTLKHSKGEHCWQFERDNFLSWGLQFFFLFLKNILNVFLVASGLNCGLWDLLWLCKGSVVAMCGLSGPTAHGILVPWTGIQPMPPVVEPGCLNHWMPGKSRIVVYLTAPWAFAH